MELTNRVAVITGGKRIGAVVAIEMAKQGADIGLCYNRSKNEADTTAAAIKALGRKVFVQQANLTKADDCEAFVNGSAKALGRLDVLVNMASIYISKPFNELTVEEYDENVAVDMRSAFICSRVIASSAPNGSSITNRSGSWMSARHRPTRCCIPPDN